MIQNFHCDYTYQIVAGSLDSYPTPLAADCTITGTSSDPLLYKNGFTYGEALQGFLLFLILVVVFFKVVIDRSLGVKGQNKENYN